ncbi:MAG: chitobiase/beta-hexosaminidase C-terminal domain-containing protein [Chitinispirillaceae bacterium]|nr:chitobiase/beta-hexosaminidase C-terminal domain-containing protein [Chitinispirillaceae bacterium]
MKGHKIFRAGDKIRRLLVLSSLIFSLMLYFLPSALFAADSVCAEVKIEISQELTLERQAFDAHMRINNGLSHITLEDVDISVSFSDESGNTVRASYDPNDTEALFFIRLDSMDNIENVTGNGSVLPSTSADIHWLIIPAPGASNGVPQGTLYYVGAKLTYTIGGEEHVTEVTPDYIFVKPMPMLTLDYFLPSEVYGDDAFTTEIEPPVPFTLGVRVANNGFGAAKKLSINSAQPKITENEQGLLIGFAIEGSEVNGKPFSNSLLVDFGDIAPNKAGIARWIMTCTLSGKFKSFTADYSHSDELGGELTSLLEDVNTHFLVQDVLVDAPGRDSIKDFLAKDGDIYRVYESENMDGEVTNQSGTSSLTPSGNAYSLSTDANAGFMYLKLTDPQGGTMQIAEVIRSDGKRVKPENAWLSKERDGEGWNYFINLFDNTTTGSYTVHFEENAQVNHAPVLQFIPDRTLLEGETVSFIVEATDPDGTIPTLSTWTLPAMAEFTDNGEGTGVFEWSPAAGQAGKFGVTFTASDGLLEDSQTATITVNSAADTDGDGMDDAWELAHFGSLDRDGAGDFDGDGISDLDEFLNGTDPTEGNGAPSLPVIISPVEGSEISDLQPVLTVEDSIDADDDQISYVFEVYSDREMTALVTSGTVMSENTGTTSWTIPDSLMDNFVYFWRVRATDGAAYTLWVYGSFFVNTENDPPGDFNVSYPADTTAVGTVTPVLEVNNSIDPDKDELTYTFNVYDDIDMTNLIVSSPDLDKGIDGSTNWVVDAPLTDGQVYYWNAVATDEDGLLTESPAASFTVDTANSAPDVPVVISPLTGSETGDVNVDIVVANSSDVDGDVLTYTFEIDTSERFDSPDKIISGAIDEEQDQTSFYAENLDDNTMYYVRVKAGDGSAESRWAKGSFFVNVSNNAPSIPVVRNPGDGAWVDTPVPELSINITSDPDNDDLTYQYQVYEDASLETLIDQGETDALNWSAGVNLTDSNTYFWRVKSIDMHGRESAWTEISSLFLKDDGDNDPPSVTMADLPGDVVTGNSVVLLWQDSDPDSNAWISLYYDTDNAGEDGVLIIDSLNEDPDGSGDSYLWDLSAVPDGTYYIYAVISDGNSSAVDYASGTITLDKTAPVVTAAPDGGTYSAAQVVTLSAGESAVIYYTLDGSDPGLSSDIYSSPIEISDSTVLKAFAVDTVGNQGVIEIFEYVIQDNIAVAVITSKGINLENVRVYAFTGAGSYTGKNVTTNAEGLGIFNPLDFAAGEYKFRVDYMGAQFWSDTITIPDVMSVTVLIEEEDAEITVSTSTGPKEGVRVYLFTETGSYMNIYANTDADGKVTFTLPTGEIYKFRADILGGQYWSEDSTIIGGGTNFVPVDAGGGLFTVTLEKSTGVPLEGINTYLFNTTGSYLNRTATSDISGMVQYDVPAGSYRIRADLLGNQFWNQDTVVSEDIDVIFEIPHQDIVITAEGVYQGSGTPIDSVKVYLFTQSGSYVNINGTSDLNGQVVFNLPEAAFKVRVDYMGNQYWSEDIIWQDTVIDIAMADAEVAVTGSGLPAPGVRVYLFNSSGSYLNRNELTDSNGFVTFRVPADSFKFRADYQGSQFWSGVASLAADQVNDIDISVGGGAFSLTVLKNATDPLVGTKCYVFNEAGSYLNMNDVTNSEGQVSFDLADGTYKFRIDHLGYQFWTDIVSVTDNLEFTKEITHQNIIVTVDGVFQETGTPIGNAKVYLFTPSGSYLNINATTDMNGDVMFSLPEIPFMVRADYMGKQFWSDEFTWVDPVVEIPMADAEITVSGSGLPMEGLNVYVYSAEGSYLNVNGTTDSNGQIQFRLPAETYNFRSDYQGSQFWSGAQTLDPDQVNPVDIAVGGGLFQLTVLKNATEPIVGVRCYVFNENGSYLNMSDVTSSEGQVAFELSQGSYKIRIDYLGYQYWTDIYSVPSTLLETFMIEHQDVTVIVQGLFDTAATPVEGIKVYLFSSAGSYQNKNLTTDENGNVTFNLPERGYKVRADYLGAQLWSDEFIWGTPAVNIPMADAEISTTGAGLPKERLRVYLFSGTVSYLNLNSLTDITGKTLFRIPAGTYNFRLDYQGKQFWSDAQGLTPDIVNAVQIDSGGGAFDFTVMKTAVDPLAGAKCYVYSDTGSYLNITGTTDELGQIIFDLSTGSYKIRVDHLGYQFWTDIYYIPVTLSETFLLSHQDAVISLEGIYQGIVSPIPGASIYLYNSTGSYQNLFDITDEYGDVVFRLPDAGYKARADYLGQQFWSEPFQLQDTVISVNKGLAQVHVYRSGIPLEGANVYLYSGSGSYLNRYETSDSDGIAEFLVPTGSYNFRSNEGGDQVWSGVVGIIEDIENIINIEMD